MSIYRIKADFTFEAESREDALEKIVEEITNDECRTLKFLKEDDGWCFGETKYWHYVIGCY